MIADFIGALFVAVLLFAIISMKKRPDYCDHRSNGKNFTEKEMVELTKKRKLNNPYDEPVGKGTDRCQYCGSNHIDKEFREATSILSMSRQVRNCHYCGDTIETR